ncbi:unnamed protein product [Phytophthora fragariaefolia]|uniref:Unnamed protein product n=1 Tax=Phytophthora fragariaefolia TaxID=1490495 RepID=A0A9W6UAT3_9STRA|nr:unnamed protein product [Phytophthora fragariaefolia]
MPHHAGVDLILGTDLMIPAGIWLDLYNSTARLSEEVEIPLIKSCSAWPTEPTYGDRVSDGPAESLSIPARMIADSSGKPTRVLLTNVSGKPVWFPAHFPGILWSPHGELPPDDGYVRLNSAKCNDWQVLAYEAAMDTAHFPGILWSPHEELPPDDGYVRLNSAKCSDWQVLAYEAAMDKDLLKKEQRLYADWLARQSPAVERRQYAVPKDVMKRTAAASAGSASDRTEAAVTSPKSAMDGLHKPETTESAADDSVCYEPAESVGDDPASSVLAVATTCELTDCDIAESAVAAQTDATEWDDGPNAGTAYHRVDSARHVTTELKEALRTTRKLSAELSADSKEKSPVREAINSLLSDKIEVSDVALVDDPEEDLRLRFVAAMAMCEDESITTVDNSATDPAEFDVQPTRLTWRIMHMSLHSCQT